MAYTPDPVPEGFKKINTAPTDGTSIIVGWHDIAGGWHQCSVDWKGDRHEYPGIGRPDRITWWKERVPSRTSLRGKPCEPPLYTQRYAKCWWIQAIYFGSGTAGSAPKVWQWNPVRGTWMEQGTLATGAKEYQPDEFSGWEILGEAIPPGEDQNNELELAVKLLNEAYCVADAPDEDEWRRKTKTLIEKFPALLKKE